MSCEAIHCPDSQTVRFAIYPEGLDGPRILARVSDETLCQLFGAAGGEVSLIEACGAHFAVIEAKALARHRAAPARPVTLRTADFLFTPAIETYCA